MPYAKPIPRNFQNSWNSEPAAAALPHPLPQQQQQLEVQFQCSTESKTSNLAMSRRRKYVFPLYRALKLCLSKQQPQLPPDCISLQQLQQQVTAVVAFGNVYPVLPNTNLHMSIGGGEKVVTRFSPLCHQILYKLSQIWCGNTTKSGHSDYRR